MGGASSTHGRDHSEDFGVDGRIIRMDLGERVEVVDWIHLAQDRGPVVGSCEHGNELSGPIKSVEFLD
jgi:hypothetical protein